MKFGIFVHPKRPKIQAKDILKVLRAARACYSKREPDIAIVVGGDGTFGYYGRTLSLPMLFVGVKEQDILGSKSRLAEVFFEDLCRAIKDIEEGRYKIKRERMLSVRYDGYVSHVLTDVYLERGILAGSLRYAVRVESNSSCSTDYAIGNGVIVSTSFGSSGYYSYPDRIGNGEWKGKDISKFNKNRIGICHIIPSFLIREKNGRKLPSHIRYTLPCQSIIRIRVMREANARLYGTTKHSKGIAVDVGKEVIINQSDKTAEIVRLEN